MPVNTPDGLPAVEILKKENIFLLTNTQALHQDIRPIRIALLNLMPKKEVTEAQILRLLSNSPLQIELTLVAMETHTSKNTSAKHLSSFYKYFSDIQKHKFDGLIITGSPVEHLKFEQVDYWPELQKIMDWADKYVNSTFFICWGAQAALYHHYGIQKYSYKNKQKKFGVFKHQLHHPNLPLIRGFNDSFYAPHSRYTFNQLDKVKQHPELLVVASSKEAGLFLSQSVDGRKVMTSGHLEYDLLTLHEEYNRDFTKGLNIKIPKNYYPNNNPANTPTNKWKSHGALLFSNWLNHYVYQSISLT